MKKNLLMWDETLFRDPEVFEIDYVPPEQFNHRDAQIRELAFQVKPGLRGGEAAQHHLPRPPGNREDDERQKGLCRDRRGYEEARPRLHQLPDRQHQVRYLLADLPPRHRAPAAAVGHVVQAGLRRHSESAAARRAGAPRGARRRELPPLRERDQPGALSLLRSHEAYPGVRIGGVVAIVSDMSVTLQTEVDARVASVFRPTEIYFPPYSAEEIHGILEERVLQGLYPNVLRPDMLDLVVEQTMKSGDLRVGIDLLKRAALNAEREARRSVERGGMSARHTRSPGTSTLRSRSGRSRPRSGRCWPGSRICRPATIRR